MGRTVLRCPNPQCRLNQYRTVSGNCRKCHQPYEQPEPEPNFTPRILDRPARYDIGFACWLWRHVCRLSQSGLAKKMGTHRVYISRMEHHQFEPTIGTLGRMEHALGVEPGTLMLFATAACQRIQ